MTTDSKYRTSKKNLLLKLAIGCIILSTIAVSLTLSEYYGLKQRRIIKRDFKDMYPNNRALDYQFSIGETESQVTISFLDENGKNGLMHWEYVKWYKLGWINIDSSDAEIVIINDEIENE